MSEKSNLYYLQQQMAKAIMRPLENDHMQACWIDGASMLEVAAQFIKPNKSMNSLQRLEIYNQQYWYRLLECLEDDFPALNAILGHERFEALAVAYLVCYPSRSYNLNQLGEHLAKFILEEPTLTQADQELAYDTACFEWAEIVAFSALNQTPLDQACLQNANAAEIVLRVQPYISILELNYALDDFLFQLNKRPSKSRETNAFIGRTKKAGKVSRPKKQHIFLAVHKLNNSVYYKRLTEEQFLLLKALLRGQTLMEACGELLSRLGDPSMAEHLSDNLQQYFGTWMELGWFCKSS